MNRAALQQALEHPNVKAFLAVIRAGEGTSDQAGYRRMFTGPLFDSFDRHPIQIHKAGSLASTAAGAYQFLARTWAGLVEQYHFPDFSPQCQDEGAVALIHGRGALEDVKAGRLAEAITKCNREWASLPGSPYGQPTRTMAQATATFKQNGGLLSKPTEELKEQPVIPLVSFAAAALPALLQAAPALTRIFGKSERSEQNAQALEIVANIAKEATKEPTVEAATQAIQSSPAMAAEFREAVHQSMTAGELVAVLMQATEAEDKSRDAALSRNLQLAKASGGRWLWLLGLVALIVVGMSYFITWGVLFNAVSTFSDETKAMLLGQIVILGFVTVLGFLYGSSISSRLKDEKS